MSLDDRAKYLQRSLIRPLGTYRDQLLQHYQKAKSLAERRREDLAPQAN